MYGQHSSRRPHRAPWPQAPLVPPSGSVDLPSGGSSILPLGPLPLPLLKLGEVFPLTTETTNSGLAFSLAPSSVSPPFMPSLLPLHALPLSSPLCLSFSSLPPLPNPFPNYLPGSPSEIPRLLGKVLLSFSLATCRLFFLWTFQNNHICPLFVLSRNPPEQVAPRACLSPHLY